jgi:hypothetical protein
LGFGNATVAIGRQFNVAECVRGSKASLQIRNGFRATIRLHGIIGLDMHN